MDPLDAGQARRKRWEEFRAQYSAAFPSYWTFRYLRIEVGGPYAHLTQLRLLAMAHTEPARQYVASGGCSQCRSAKSGREVRN